MNLLVRLHFLSLSIPHLPSARTLCSGIIPFVVRMLRAYFKEFCICVQFMLGARTQQFILDFMCVQDRYCLHYEFTPDMRELFAQSTFHSYSKCILCFKCANRKCDLYNYTIFVPMEYTLQQNLLFIFHSSFLCLIGFFIMKR